MKWNDLIELIMAQNKGTASLNFLYEQAPKHKDLPSGDWQKTLRGVLYREVNRGRFKKIGLGVYAVPSYDEKNFAYSYALKNRPVDEYLGDIEDKHSAIEGMLIELGNFFEYATYTGDLNRSFDGKKLRELCSMTEVPEFTYSELQSLISKCDTIWFTKAGLPFPKCIFEVESTTDFTNSMLKMYQLVDFDTKFVLVASQGRETVFANRIGKEPFVKHKPKFSFRSFKDVGRLYFSSVEHYELKSRFMP